MARPGLFLHRKFIDLSMRLGSKALAVGCLECVWRHGYEDGNPLVGDAAAVEYSCEWRGEPGALARALVETGFLDDTGRGLAIHDLLDHAPKYVKQRCEREEARRAEGVTLREVRAAAGRKGGKAKRRKSASGAARKQARSKRKQVASGREANGLPPSSRHPHPAPAPAPAPEGEKRESVAPGATRAPASPSKGGPTVEEWTALARERFPDWPEDDVRNAFTFASSEGKLHARGWEAMLSRLHAAHLRHVATSKAKLSPAERERLATGALIARARGGASS